MAFAACGKEDPFPVAHAALAAAQSSHSFMYASRPIWPLQPAARNGLSWAQSGRFQTHYRKAGLCRKQPSPASRSGRKWASG
jgi:hypothetical protein